jgi:hypothetical protein
MFQFKKEVEKSLIFASFPNQMSYFYFNNNWPEFN